MKPRHKKSQPTHHEKEQSGQNLDQLGIERGQNAEKGNTVNPRNVHPTKKDEAVH